MLPSRSDARRDADGPALLIGVVSWPTREGQRRRDSIRKLCTVSGQLVALRFVLKKAAASPVERNHKTAERRDDVLQFELPRAQIAWRGQSDIVGKFLLLNAFFRYAASLPGTIRYVGRADDDALFNASAVALQLISLSADFTHVVYGSARQWYMWDSTSMSPTCFAWSPRRAQVEGQRARNASGDRHNVCHKKYTGPFPFTAGPLAIWSHAVLQEVVGHPSFQRDEAFVVNRWWNENLISPADGKLYRPNERSHPRARILYEDVYYSSLIAQIWSNRSLQVIDVPMKELAYPTVNLKLAAPRNRRLRRSIIYHRLTSRSRLEGSGLLEANRSMLRAPETLTMRCRTLQRAFAGRELRCCRDWRYCSDVSVMPSAPPQAPRTRSWSR